MLADQANIHGPQGKYGAIYEYLNKHEGRDMKGTQSVALHKSRTIMPKDRVFALGNE
jgi:hypothetical protein